MPPARTVHAPAVDDVGQCDGASLPPVMPMAATTSSLALETPARIPLSPARSKQRVDLVLTGSEHRAVAATPRLAHAAAIYEGLAASPADVQDLQQRVAALLRRPQHRETVAALRAAVQREVWAAGPPAGALSSRPPARATTVTFESLVDLSVVCDLAGFPLGERGIAQMVEAMGTAPSAPPSNAAIARAYTQIIAMVQASWVDVRKWDAVIVAQAERFDLDPAWVKAVVAAESAFDRTLVSPVGAVGLAQLVVPTYLEVAREERKAVDQPQLRTRLRKLETALADLVARTKGLSEADAKQESLRQQLQIQQLGEALARAERLPAAARSRELARIHQDPLAILFDAELNLRCGVRYLRKVKDQMSANVGVEGRELERLSSAGYNAGPNLVERLGRVPRIDETMRYVDKIALLSHYYRRQLAARSVPDTGMLT
ncbi:MAG: transglycosylase SLT domain-containing protein [Myxococcota bacterium]